MHFLITYQPELHREPESVEADSLDRRGHGQLVLRGTALVMGQPREVVVRRLRATDVASIEQSHSPLGSSDRLRDA